MAESIPLETLGMCQKRAILLDSVNLVQARNCQVDLTHALVHLGINVIRVCRDKWPHDERINSEHTCAQLYLGHLNSM